jgi:membrane protein implicated in regulation of membrane protease activity
VSRGWWAVLAAWAMLGLALLAAAGLLAAFIVLAAVAYLVLLAIRRVLGPQLAPPWHQTRNRPERHRLADDLAVPIEDVIAVAELDATAVGRQRPGIGATRCW